MVTNKRREYNVVYQIYENIIENEKKIHNIKKSKILNFSFFLI